MPDRAYSTVWRWIYIGFITVATVALTSLYIQLRNQNDKIRRIQMYNSAQIQQNRVLIIQIAKLQRAEADTCQGKHILVQALVHIEKEKLKTTFTIIGKEAVLKAIRDLKKIDCVPKPKIKTRVHVNTKTRTVVVHVKSTVGGKATAKTITIHAQPTEHKVLVPVTKTQTVTVTIPKTTTNTQTITKPTVTTTRVTTVPVPVEKTVTVTVTVQSPTVTVEVPSKKCHPKKRCP